MLAVGYRMVSGFFLREVAREGEGTGEKEGKGPHACEKGSKVWIPGCIRLVPDIAVSDRNSRDGIAPCSPVVI